MPIKHDTSNNSRPHDTKETPNSILTSELKATVKAMGYIRIAVKRQLEYINQILKKDDYPIESRLKIMTDLAVISQSLAKNADTLSKYLMDKRVRNVEDTETETKSQSNSILTGLLKS